MKSGCSDVLTQRRSATQPPTFTRRIVSVRGIGLTAECAEPIGMLIFVNLAGENRTGDPN